MSTYRDYAKKLASAAKLVSATMPAEAKALVEQAHRIADLEKRAGNELSFDDFLSEFKERVSAVNEALDAVEDGHEETADAISSSLDAALKAAENGEFGKWKRNSLTDNLVDKNLERADRLAEADESFSSVAELTVDLRDWVLDWRLPADAVTVVVENSEDDPFTLNLHVQDQLASKWADDHGSLDGGTWESVDGPDFIHDHAGCRPGIFDEWKKEGFKLDLSQADDDPYGVFRGLDAEELEKTMNEYTAIDLHNNEELKQTIRDEVLGGDGE